MHGGAWRSIGCSHTGLIRKHNEDSFLDRPDVGLWVVADGMGGMTAGEVASQAIVAALGSLGDTLAPPALTEAIVSRIGSVNRDLRELARRRGPEVVIGSTVAGLAIRGGHFACFWAGDSRVYRWRDGELQQLTRDHSVVQELVDAGLVALADAERHPQASVIRRAVGADDAISLDWVHAPVASGDVFLLCSDGLTRMVGDREIETALGSPTIEQGCQTLLSLTLSRGARDNVTIIVVSAA